MSGVLGGDRFSSWKGAARFPSLDGLRCLSIVPVVWHHAVVGRVDGVLERGPLGVDLFFTISGFLITTLLLREREANQTVSLARFYVRRSLRIFPLYYAVLGAFVLHALVVRQPGPMRDHFLASLPYYATYTSNWLVDFGVSHPVVFAFAWSLAAEEQFYLAWPPCLRATRGLFAPFLFMAALLLVDQAAERSWLTPFLSDAPLASRILRSLSTPICLGALLAIALRDRRTFRVAAALLGSRLSAPIAFAALVFAATWPLPLLPTQLVMAALVGACSLRADHRLRWLTDGRLVRHVGVVSYGIYLLNVPILTATRRLLGAAATSGAVFGIGLAATVALATLTHHLVERPFLRLRDRWPWRPQADSKTSLPPRMTTT